MFISFRLSSSYEDLPMFKVTLTDLETVWIEISSNDPTPYASCLLKEKVISLRRGLKDRCKQISAWEYSIWIPKFVIKKKKSIQLLLQILPEQIMIVSKIGNNTSKYQWTS